MNVAVIGRHAPGARSGIDSLPVCGGAKVRACDPAASVGARRLLFAKHGAVKCNDLLMLAFSAHEAAEDAGALVVISG